MYGSQVGMPSHMQSETGSVMSVDGTFGMHSNDNSMRTARSSASTAPRQPPSNASTYAGVGQPPGPRGPGPQPPPVPMGFNPAPGMGGMQNQMNQNYGQ